MFEGGGPLGGPNVDASIDAALSDPALSDPALSDPARVASVVDAAVALLRVAVDALGGLDYAGVAGAQLLAVLRGVETETRRLSAVAHQPIAQLEQRGVAGELGCTSTASLLAQVLRLDKGETWARVRAAGELGPRHAISGEPPTPLFPAVAGAQADWVISPGHARVITRMISELPAELEAVHRDQVEATLVANLRQIRIPL